MTSNGADDPVDTAAREDYQYERNGTDNLFPKLLIQIFKPSLEIVIESIHYNYLSSKEIRGSSAILRRGS